MDHFYNVVVLMDWGYTQVEMRDLENPATRLLLLQMNVKHK